MKFVPKPLVETADISRGKTTVGTFLKNLALVSLFFGGVYFLLGLIAWLVAAHVPDSWERNFAGVGPLLGEEDVRLERAQGILDRLLEEEGLRDLDYRLYLVHHAGPNAMAFPGGGIGVTPELLELVESEAGLALVLAHELGHHQHRHILHRLGRGILYGLFRAVLLGGDGMAPVGGAMGAAELGFSRGQEHEADEAALLMVHRIYGDVDGALEFFELIETREPQGEWFGYFSTHPLTRDRLARLRGRAEELMADGAPEK